MQKMTTFILLAVAAIIAIVFFTQCNTSKTPVTTPAADDKLISMYSGPCFGTCPVYTLTVFQNGSAEYAGDRFTDKAGLYSMQLSDQQLKELKTTIANANLIAMQDEYESRIPDLALVKITYYADGKEKVIKGKEDRPAALMEIEKQLKAMAEMEGWKLEKAPDYGLAAGEIANEIIVQLRDGVTIEEFIESNNSRFLQLKMKEKVAPNLNYYVVTYEPSVYGPKATLQQFKESKMTVDASFNKQTQLRN